MLEKWITKDKKHIYDFRIFDAYVKKSYHPGWKKEAEYAFIDSPNWVNIVPVTQHNEIIMVKQFRHGIDEFTLEIPGGLIEPDEDPKEAAKRECMEETGWGSESEAEYTGKTHPNPAFMNNLCYSYVWKNCTLISEQNLDGNEEIEVIKINENNLQKYILDFKIVNSLVLNGIFFYLMNNGKI